MSAGSTTNHPLVLTEEERAELLRVLEQSVEDVRVEHRRTQALEYREQVRREELVLQGLLDKLRGLDR